jgi:hypothetical protein
MSAGISVEKSVPISTGSSIGAGVAISASVLTEEAGSVLLEPAPFNLRM